jgi:hypothetical protein
MGFYGKRVMIEKRKHKRHIVEGMGISARTFFDVEIEVIDISASGGLIRCSKSFNIGSEYTFKFSHRGEIIAVKGSIIWSKLSGSRKREKGEVMPIYTAGIMFGTLMAGKVEQFEQFISDKARELRERRLSAVKVKVYPPEKAVLSYLETCVVKDISPGGLRLETGHEPPVETLFTMDLVLEEKETPLHCRGRIVFCHELAEIKPKRYAVGVEFKDISESDNLKLGNFIEKLS